MTLRQHNDESYVASFLSANTLVPNRSALYRTKKNPKSFNKLLGF